jgi:hypothetical protein
MADRRRFTVGCSLAALDAAGHWHYVALDYFSVGDAIALAASPYRTVGASRINGRGRQSGDIMAKRTTCMATKSSQKVSKTSFRVIKKQTKERAVAVKAATKKAKRPSKTAATLIGREARREERFRELVAWYMLQGVDEATAKRRAQRNA